MSIKLYTIQICSKEDYICTFSSLQGEIIFQKWYYHSFPRLFYKSRMAEFYGKPHLTSHRYSFFPRIE